MIQVDETTQEFYKQMPFSAEEWGQTPQTVQGFVLSTVKRLQELETELATLREQVNRNSRNSSQPLSGDGSSVPRKTSKRTKSGRKRGAQKGHKGTRQKLVSIEQVKDSYDIKPEKCSCCGHGLRQVHFETLRKEIEEHRVLSWRVGTGR